MVEFCEKKGIYYQDYNKLYSKDSVSRSWSEMRNKKACQIATLGPTSLKPWIFGSRISTLSLLFQVTHFKSLSFVNLRHGAKDVVLWIFITLDRV
ncbi:hypothetical protein L798_15541 [Zootermopsis nevadensis]|uniref:Uncharacterized protein n=1 Tax=Zootermopsis nevadensis TaxID=136037 RepID=A0A067QMD5_ZOONE|nr:hypothetical protein L798_15541 [Zootermopsis nevadensis]